MGPLDQWRWTVCLLDLHQELWWDPVPVSAEHFLLWVLPSPASLRTKIYFLHQTERCYSAEGQRVTGRAGECKGWGQEQKPHLCQNWLLFTLACSLHIVGAHSVLPLKIPSTVRGEILSLFAFLLLLSQFYLHRGSPLCPWWTLTLEGLTGV